MFVVGSGRHILGYPSIECCHMCTRRTYFVGISLLLFREITYIELNELSVIFKTDCSNALWGLMQDMNENDFNNLNFREWHIGVVSGMI